MSEPKNEGDAIAKLPAAQLLAHISAGLHKPKKIEGLPDGSPSLFAKRTSQADRSEMNKIVLIGADGNLSLHGYTALQYAMVRMCVVDEAGTRVFLDEAGTQALDSLDAEVYAPLVAAVESVNAQRADQSIDGAAKNSSPTKVGASRTVSRSR
jgi:hypothetical protein